jgi:fluoroacetyl-CoA thioesterase
MDFAVKVGASKERTITVSSNQTTSFLWEGENVLSTPSMIAEMEETCRLLLKEQVIPDPEWDSVGTVVNIEHLAATPVGTEVFLKTEVVSVNGKRVMFKVEARDKLEKIGEGMHERFIIDVPRFRAKFNEKQKQLQQQM